MDEKVEESLGEALPKECARVREVFGHYKAIGPAGNFGAMMIEKALKRADAAMVSGDVVGMLAAYEELKLIED